MNWLEDPALYIVALALVALFRPFPRWVRGTFIALAVLLFLTPLPFWLIQTLEREVPAVTETQRQAIVVLTGGIVHFEPARDMFHWGSSADRATEAARLYKKGLAPLLIVTGTEREKPGLEREAESIARYWREQGVPPEHIVVENQARDTSENGARTASLLAERGITDFFLVTTACHMPRSRRVFEKLGLSPSLYPVDFVPVPQGWAQFRVRPLERLLVLRAVIHEYGGMGWYWVRGWI
ncbi:MAG TPA: YdcF family protein [Bdellovibrionales bacterium]|nr:YdcF family protein [Bdellovibrionales bacterium]